MMARSVGPASVMVDDSELEDELAQLLLDTDNPSDNQGGQSFTGMCFTGANQSPTLTPSLSRVARSADDASGGGNAARLIPPPLTMRSQQGRLEK